VSFPNPARKRCSKPGCTSRPAWNQPFSPRYASPKPYRSGARLLPAGTKYPCRCSRKSQCAPPHPGSHCRCDDRKGQKRAASTLYRSSHDPSLEGDGFELPVREHRAMAPSHGFAAASHREAALRGAPAAQLLPRANLQNNSRSSEATRRRILDAAYQLFYQRGFARVGVDEVAELAGITKRTLDYHFESKDDLLAAVLQLQHELSFELIRKS
jgi:hypothetical protein